MQEWSSYSLEDFLMFSARTYHRLFELHNRALWPAHFAALAAGLATIWLARRSDRRAHRVGAGLLAAAWLAAGGGFLWLRFATIHTGGRAMAAAFAVEAALLAWVGALGSRGATAPSPSAARRLGLAIAVYGVALHPLLARLLGRPWAQAELFALTPDATVAASFGLLLVAPRSRWFLWPIPFAWSLFSGMTLWAMRAPEWWVLPGLALASVALAIAGNRSRAGAVALSASL